MQFKGSPERVFPEDRKNSGPVNNIPDRPVVEQTDLRGLRFNVPGKRNRVNGPFASRGTLIEGGWGQTFEATEVTPSVVRPLKPVFEVGHGGGRVYGGGTSAEALRRARRKQSLIR